MFVCVCVCVRAHIQPVHHGQDVTQGDFYVVYSWYEFEVFLLLN